MKKNIGLCVITFSIFLVGILLVHLMSRELNYIEPIEKEQLSLADNNIEIYKTETNNELIYEIKDYVKNISYSWTFNKDKNYKEGIKDSIELEKKLGLEILTDTNIEEINDIVKEDKLVISFDYHGELPTKALVKINVENNFKNGELLYLYYYNEENNKIEYINNGIQVRNGYVEFEIEHCSNYMLTASIIQDAINNPRNLKMVIGIMMVVVVLLIAVTLFQNKK